MSINGEGEGSLSKEEVQEILAKVESFMGTQDKEVASLIGVSTIGVDKDVRCTLCKIQRT